MAKFHFFQTSVKADIKYNIIILNKHSFDYLNKITKTDYKLLIELLRDLEHPNLSSALQVYGAYFLPNGKVFFDDSIYEKYKNEVLKLRIENMGYTFFRLVNEEGKIIALASGNVENNNLRLLNLVVHHSFRKKGLGTLLLGGIGQYILNNHPDAKIVIPISYQSQQKTLDFYKQVIPIIASKFDIPEISLSKEQVEIKYKPQVMSENTLSQVYIYHESPESLQPIHHSCSC